MLTIIESGSQAWAFAAADGDLHIYSRQEAGEWTEVLLSEDSEQIDRDGSSILEALYEQNATRDGDEAEEEEPMDEDEEEPVDEEEEEPADEEEQPEDDVEEEKPRPSRARARAKKK